MSNMHTLALATLAYITATCISPVNCTPQSTKTRLDTVQIYRSCVSNRSIPPSLLTDQTTNSTLYNLLNKQWNLRHPQVFPLAYFLPRNTADVQQGVKCGSQHRIPVTPNSGGHSYEAISYGNNESIIIDFRNMKRIDVNVKDKTASIQPGAIVGQIIAQLWNSGGFFIPMGICMSVGIGGHAIGGGEGYMVSAYGTAMDNVVELTVVDARGNVHVASADKEPDLYWAFRGVGPGYFGIVTNFKFRLHDAKGMKLTFVSIRYPVKRFAEVLFAYQNFLDWQDKNNPRDNNAGFFVTNDNMKSPIPNAVAGIQIQAFHVQDATHPSGNASFLKALQDIFPKGGHFEPTLVPWLEFALKSGYAPVMWKGKLFKDLVTPGAPTLDQLTKDIALPRYHKHKTFFVKKKFSLKELEGVGKLVGRIPQNIWLMVTDERGALLDIPANQTAYVHRNSRFQMAAHYEGIEASGPILKKGLDWLKEYSHFIKFMDGGETYQNYPDLELEDYLDRYYGSNLPRLKQVKRKYDPTDYFHHKTSIPIK